MRKRRRGPGGVGGRKKAGREGRRKGRVPGAEEPPSSHFVGLGGGRRFPYRGCLPHRAPVEGKERLNKVCLRWRPFHVLGFWGEGLGRGLYCFLCRAGQRCGAAVGVLCLLGRGSLPSGLKWRRRIPEQSAQREQKLRGRLDSIRRKALLFFFFPLLLEDASCKTVPVFLLSQLDLREVLSFKDKT